MKLPNKNKIKALFLITALMVSLIMLVSITLSWIETAINPVIQASKMEFAVSPGLLMKLNGVQTDSIDINTYLSDSTNKSFILSEMSSYDGKTFFVRLPDEEAVATLSPSTTPSSTPAAETKKIKLRLADSSDQNVSYIHLKVKMIADGADRDVFLGTTDVASAIPGETPDPSLRLTYIDPVAPADAESLKPLRIALTYSYEYEEVTYAATEIFATYLPTQENPFKAVQYIDWTNFQMIESGLSVQNVSLLSKYFYEEGRSTNTPWFTLPEGVTADVELKIWLEGCDQNCVDYYSGSQLKFKLTFYTPPDPTT